jgi:hypothetical protein
MMLGVDVIAARMGHSAAMSLAVYAHARPGSQRAAAALGALLDGDAPALRVVELAEAATSDHGTASAVL